LPERQSASAYSRGTVNVNILHEMFHFDDDFAAIYARHPIPDCYFEKTPIVKMDLHDFSGIYIVKTCKSAAQQVELQTIKAANIPKITLAV